MPPQRQSIHSSSHGFGWRESFLIVNLILVAVMVPIGWLPFREHPEKYGIVPDGESASGYAEGEILYVTAGITAALALG